jgi:hypothetical protein
MNRKLEHLIGLPLNLLTLGLYFFFKTQIHHEMTESFGGVAVIKASFTEFRKEFEKVQWETDRRYRSSLFTGNYESEFHADIIRINNVGYKLTTYGFIRAKTVKRKKIKELNRRIAKRTDL